MLGEELTFIIIRIILLKIQGNHIEIIFMKSEAKSRKTFSLLICSIGQLQKIVVGYSGK